MTTVLQEHAQAPPEDTLTPGVCRLEKIEKTYYKPDGTVLVSALGGIDLDIHHGEYIAIMGPSGSGKSTIMNILGCLDQSSAGRYFLDGRDVSTLDDEELSAYRGRKIGFVFQAFNLISQLTIEENVEVPLFYQHIDKSSRKERARDKLELVGLGDRMEHRPSELSGGQQQRAAIARALAAEPVVLMADEPTGNLDSTTGEAILTLFEDLQSQGMTIIMVTHDDEVADRCERVVRLRDGLIESDEHLRTRARKQP